MELQLTQTALSAMLSLKIVAVKGIEPLRDGDQSPLIFETSAFADFAILPKIGEVDWIRASKTCILNTRCLPITSLPRALRRIRTDTVLILSQMPTASWAMRAKTLVAPASQRTRISRLRIG